MLSYKQYILNLIEEGVHEDTVKGMSQEQMEKTVDEHAAGKKVHDAILGHIARRIESTAHLHKLAGHANGWIAAQTASNPHATHETAKILQGHTGHNSHYVQKAVGLLSNRVVAGDETPFKVAAGSASSGYAPKKTPDTEEPKAEVKAEKKPAAKALPKAKQPAAKETETAPSKFKLHKRTDSPIADVKKGDDDVGQVVARPDGTYHASHVDTTDLGVHPDAKTAAKAVAAYHRTKK